MRNTGRPNYETATTYRDASITQGKSDCHITEQKEAPTK
jgi:hypothetical protein